MISLLLDTNILHQEGLDSGSMQLLRRLVDASHVEVFVPEIVKKEFLTRRVMEAKERLKDAQNSLFAIGKKVSKRSEAQSKVDTAQTYIRGLESLIEEVIYNDFNQWELDLSTTIIPFNPESMSDVMEDYFSGDGVYRKPKSREDIPDAIINKSVDELVDKKGEVTIAIKDGAFKKHLRKNQRVSLVDSLEEFLGLENNVNKISELDALSERTGKVKGYLRGGEFKRILIEYLTESDGDIEEIYLEEEDIRLSDELEVDTFGERINFPQASTIHDLIVEGVSHLSSTSYFLKISFYAKATLNYCANYADYLYIEEDTYREVVMDSMSGDGICDISEIFMFKFYGHIQIEFEEELDIDEIKAHSRYLGSKANPISTEIDVDKAEIVVA